MVVVVAVVVNNKIRAVVALAREVIVVVAVVEVEGVEIPKNPPTTVVEEGVELVVVENRRTLTT